MKPKVLFIYPNVPESTLLPLSIAQLSACLKQAGAEMEIFDTTFYDTMESFEKRKVELLQLKPFEAVGKLKSKDEMYSDLWNMVNDYKPDFICVTVVEDTIELAFQLMVSIQDYKCVKIVGGVAVRWWQNELRRSGVFDIIWPGEGESFLVDLVGRGWTEDQSRYLDPVNLNKLPFIDYSVFGEGRLDRVMHGAKKRMLHVEADRGCLFDCTYCCAPAIRKASPKGYYRRKSNDRLITELKYLKKTYKPDYVIFDSETFLLRPYDELLDFCIQYYCEVDIPFWVQTRPETVIKEKLEILKMAGVADMQFGIEHGNEEFRKKWLKRKGSNKQIEKALNIVEDLNIPYTVNNIIGFPDETRDLVFDTIRFNSKFNPKTMNCYFMIPYRGTWMYDYCVREGLLKEGSRSNQLLRPPGVEYRYMREEELLGLQRCFSLYARMAEYWEDIRIAERFDDRGNEMFRRLSKKFREKFFYV